MRHAGHLIALPDFVPADRLKLLSDAALNCRSAAQRVHILQHKRGETISYERLRRHAPEIVAFYQSPELCRIVSDLAGTPVMTTPLRDQSSCSVLIYDQPGDHIGWHYDYNFYNGRHFTALLSLVNEHLQKAQLSSAKLLIRKRGKEQAIPTPANTLVLFEGVQVCHRVSPLGDSERRIILSMTFCTDPATTPLKDLERRIKDTAYFGLSALRT